MKDELIRKLKEYIEFLEYYEFGLSKQDKAEKGKLLTEIAIIEKQIAEDTITTHDLKEIDKANELENE